MSTYQFTTAEGVADEVARRIALCTKALGAETDLGVKVFQGRRKVSDDMLPCASIVEATDITDQARAGTAVNVSQRFMVFAYVPCDPNNPNKAAHAAIRDMKRAVFTTGGHSDYTWQRRVTRVEYKGKDIGPRSDGASFVLAAIEFIVHFVEDVAAP